MAPCPAERDPAGGAVANASMDNRNRKARPERALHPHGRELGCEENLDRFDAAVVKIRKVGLPAQELKTIGKRDISE